LKAKGYFITGTDTDVGKTYVACQLMAVLRQQILKVAGFKPVASGADIHDGILKNNDALLLIEQASISEDYQTINPYCFAPAIAPHIAAQQAGCVIELNTIKQKYSQLANKSDVVIVEGAGGWCVPLTDDLGFYDIPISLKLPVILVVGLKLGCINHALLTQAAILQSGCEIVGWVANEVAPGFQEKDQNIAYLKNKLESPLLASVDFSTEKEKLGYINKWEISTLF